MRPTKPTITRRMRIRSARIALWITGGWMFGWSAVLLLLGVLR